MKQLYGASCGEVEHSRRWRSRAWRGEKLYILPALGRGLSCLYGGTDFFGFNCDAFSLWKKSFMELHEINVLLAILKKSFFTVFCKRMTTLEKASLLG